MQRSRGRTKATEAPNRVMAIICWKCRPEKCCYLNFQGTAWAAAYISVGKEAKVTGQKMPYFFLLPRSLTDTMN
jgi:hypothetical protein